MNAVAPAVRGFEFFGQGFRVVDRDGAPWFVLADVCAVLEIVNSRDAAARLDEDEKGVVTADTPGGAQSVTIVNESGLFLLILTSRKPEARQFKRWVTGTVLPSIRQTGAYAPAGFALPRTMAEALRLATDQAEKAEAMRAELEAAAPKVAFVDRYVDSSGTKGFRETAKLLGANEARFRDFLQAHGVFYRLGGAWMPRQQHVDAGRLTVKAGTSTSGHAYNQARFTPKGVQWIAGLWGQHQIGAGT